MQCVRKHTQQLHVGWFYSNTNYVGPTIEMQIRCDNTWIILFMIIISYANHIPAELLAIFALGRF